MAVPSPSEPDRVATSADAAGVDREDVVPQLVAHLDDGRAREDAGSGRSSLRSQVTFMRLIATPEAATLETES